MMQTVDTQTDYYAARVRLAHTETATRDEIIARARLHYDGHDYGVSVDRADDFDGPAIFEVATVTFWRD